MKPVEKKRRYKGTEYIIVGGVHSTPWKYSGWWK